MHVCLVMTFGPASSPARTLAEALEAVGLRE